MGSQIDAMEGIETTNTLLEPQQYHTPLQLSELEAQILSLYDRLEELNLEITLLNGTQHSQETLPANVTEKHIADEQHALLSAKALYSLRSNIVHSVLTANPTLRAIHAGTNATPIERALLPLLPPRDALGAALSKTQSAISSNLSQLSAAEIEHVALVRENQDLAAQMLALAEQAKGEGKEDISDAGLRGKVARLEEEVRESRMRYRLLRGVAGAVVVGSGMDWGRDVALRELVLEGESEDEE